MPALKLNALQRRFTNPCIMHMVLVKLLHFTGGQVSLESFILSPIYLKILQHEQCDIYL